MSKPALLREPTHPRRPPALLLFARMLVADREILNRAFCFRLRAVVPSDSANVGRFSGRIKETPRGRGPERQVLWMSFRSSAPAEKASSLASMVPSLSGLAALNLASRQQHILSDRACRRCRDQRPSEAASSRRPLSSLASSVPSLSRIKSTEDLGRTRLSLRQIDGAVIVGVEGLESCGIGPDCGCRG